MLIKINTDHNIEGNEALAAYVKDETEQALSRFGEQITRVGIHLSDENSDKKGGKDTMRCVMEVRLEGRHPLAVTHQAETLEKSVTGAITKLTRLIESTIGRLNDQRGSRVEAAPAEPDEFEE